MKKIIILVVMFIIAISLILFHKKENVLKCSLITEQTFGTDSQEVILKSDADNKIIHYSRKHKITINESNQEFFEDYYKSILAGYDNLINRKGVTIDTVKNDPTFTINLDVKVKDLDNTTKELLPIKVDKLLDELKSTLKTKGYDCKK